MNETRDADIAALERRLEASVVMQKKILDAILVLGLASGSWDAEDVAQTLLDLAASTDRAGASDSFVNDMASDARVMLRTLSCLHS